MASVLKRRHVLPLLLAVGGIIAVALVVEIIALQNKIADSEAREQQLIAQLDNPDPIKTTDILADALVFHDLSFKDALTKAKGEGKPVMNDVSPRKK
ncbi:MAG TPA: hypothetical protein VH092_18350, partial [Urbifossiella sp.]|nr:hypothetical protein [Urbifossiella sp.]